MTTLQNDIVPLIETMVETASSMSEDADVTAGDLDSAQPRSHIVSLVVLESNDQEGDNIPSGNL